MELKLLYYIPVLALLVWVSYLIARSFKEWSKESRCAVFIIALFLLIYISMVLIFFTNVVLKEFLS